MDYKREIICMVNAMEDSALLSKIYQFCTAFIFKIRRQKRHERITDIQ